MKNLYDKLLKTTNDLTSLSPLLYSHDTFIHSTHSSLAFDCIHLDWFVFKKDLGEYTLTSSQLNFGVTRWGFFPVLTLSHDNEAAFKLT